MLPLSRHFSASCSCHPRLKPLEEPSHVRCWWKVTYSKRAKECALKTTLSGSLDVVNKQQVCFDVSSVLLVVTSMLVTTVVVSEFSVLLILQNWFVHLRPSITSRAEVG